MKKLKPAPKAFRGELPPDYPEPLPAYKVQTLLEEYRVLAIVFAVVALALAVYFVKSILTAPPPPPPVLQAGTLNVAAAARDAGCRSPPPR